MSPDNQTPAADTAAEVVIDEGNSDLAPAETTADFSDLIELRKQRLAAQEERDRPAPPQPAYADRVDRTDVGNAVLLRQLTKGDLRYVYELKRWLCWDGSRWNVDDDGSLIQAAAIRVAEYYATLAAQYYASIDTNHDALESTSLRKLAAANKAWELQCRSRARISAMLDIASKLEGVALSAKELDRDPYLLGVMNGVVDLRTGTLREASRDEYITKRCSVEYDPESKAPRWERFIEEITGSPLEGGVWEFAPRPALADYVKRRSGYFATGLTREHVMFVDNGEGSNGKDVYSTAIKNTLGDYATTLPAEALMATRFGSDAERATPHTAKLEGARLAHASETRTGQHLDVAVIKLHTGGGRLTARNLHENPREFESTHKLLLATNELPGIEHLDAAMRGRLHVVPFDRKWNRPAETAPDPALPTGDKTLAETLRTEAAGILTWVIEGAVEYLRNGLQPPDEVLVKTRSYFFEQDWFRRWLATTTRCPAPSGQLANELYSAFRVFVAAEGGGDRVFPSNQSAFSRALKSAQVANQRTTAGVRYGLATSMTFEALAANADLLGGAA